MTVLQLLELMFWIPMLVVVIWMIWELYQGTL